MPQDRPSLTVADLAGLCNGRTADSSRGGVVLRAVAAAHEAGPDAITWVTEARHAEQAAASQAGAILCTEKLMPGEPRAVFVDDPEFAMTKVLAHFFVPPQPPEPGIHPTAVVDASARLGRDVRVGAHAVIHGDVHIGDGSVVHEGVSIGRGVTIGTGTTLFDRVVIYDRCTIGNDVVIHAGSVIGADGFGYVYRKGRHHKLPHLGTVIIEDDVELGAGVCVDRGKLGATRIGRGTKIDNLVQVAHNVQIAPLCVIAAQTGISGSVEVGAGVAMGGQVGIAHGLKIGSEVRIAAKSGIMNDVPDGQTVVGSPAQDRSTAFRELARVRKLPELFEQVAELTKRVRDLEAAADHPKPD